MTSPSTEQTVEQVRDRYSRIATGEIAGCGCGTGCGSEDDIARSLGYQAADLESVGGSNLGLGCGAPIPNLGLRAGETVLDLGSGAGIDAFLAAKEVGSTGKVIGVDMTPTMIERARGAAERLGLSNVEFREGRLEQLPVEAGTVDAVTSNCVINLVPDKDAVFEEVARVLRPGGRLVVSDIILDRPLPEALGNDLLAYVGCLAGAALRDRYFEGLRAAGLDRVEVLRDIDYVEVMMQNSSAEIEELLARTGTTPDEVRGAVRSVTYRAYKAEAKACCGPTCCS